MGRGVIDYILTPELLNQKIQELQDCEEFKNSKINVITELTSGRPVRKQTGVDEEGIPIFTMEFESKTTDGKKLISAKLNPKLLLAPVVNVYSISLGPAMWDQNDYFNGKINTVKIAPTSYDTVDFTPKKHLILTFSPEMAQDAAMDALKEKLRETDQIEEKKEFVATTKDEIVENTEIAESMMSTISKDEIKKTVKEEENKYIESLIEMVRHALNNPGDYIPPAIRSIILRITEDSIVPNAVDIREESDTNVQF